MESRFGDNVCAEFVIGATFRGNVSHRKMVDCLAISGVVLLPWPGMSATASGTRSTGASCPCPTARSASSTASCTSSPSRRTCRHAEHGGWTQNRVQGQDDTLSSMIHDHTHFVRKVGKRIYQIIFLIFKLHTVHSTHTFDFGSLFG